MLRQRGGCGKHEVLPLFGSGWVVIPGVQQEWEGELLSAPEGTACAQRAAAVRCLSQVGTSSGAPPVADHLPGSRAIRGPSGRCRMLWCKCLRTNRQL